MEIKIAIKEIFNNETISKLDNKIAEINSCTIYKENLDLLLDLKFKEIEISGLKIDKIESFIIQNQNQILRFSKLFWDKSTPASLGKGICITYAIYLIFLIEQDDSNLILYLKKRGIPNNNKFLVKLKNIFAELRN